MFSALLGTTLINANHKQISLALTHHLSSSSLTTRVFFPEQIHPTRMETLHIENVGIEICNARHQSVYEVNTCHERRNEHSLRNIKEVSEYLHVEYPGMVTVFLSQLSDVFFTLKARETEIYFHSFLKECTVFERVSGYTFIR